MRWSDNQSTEPADNSKRRGHRRIEMNMLRAVIGALLLGLGSAHGASAQETGKVVLGWAANLQTAPIVVAIEKGYFKDAGLEVKSVRFVTGREALEALLGGQLDLGFMAEFPPVIGALRKQPFRIVTTLSNYSGNRIISTAKSGFHDIKDLEGKKIGTTLGSNNDYFTQLVLQKYGVKATVVNVAAADIVPALVRGDIDAGVPFPDFYQKARTALGSDYRDLVSKDYIAWFVVAASMDLLNKRPGDLNKFLSALVKADEFIKSNPAEAQELLAKEMTGLADLAQIKSLWPEAGYTVGLNGTLLDLMVDEAKWIAERGLIKDVKADPAELRGYIADAPMKALDPARVNLP
jgi:NitT/TauT family transport system substrate-binding protein